jgi:hypothetical protein
VEWAKRGIHKFYFCKLQLMPLDRFASCIGSRALNGYCGENPRNRRRHEASSEKRVWTIPGAMDKRSGATVLFQEKHLTCFIRFSDDMEEAVHILLALAVILLVERLIQAGSV